MYAELLHKKRSLVVIGLGYVGLPIALEFAKYFSVVGFDINAARIAMLRQRRDPSRELSAAQFEGRDIRFTDDEADLAGDSFFVVAVPTPVDVHRVPDLNPLLRASETIGRVIQKGAYVIFESTVYPGCTEEDCLPVIEKISGLKAGVDFKIGYSPERLNPGDKENTVDKIEKIVSGCDAESLEEIANVYAKAITAGVYRASSIKVAEAAKVIENTQRDLNISFMNELAVMFDLMGIDTHEVLKAAATKWNFLQFSPGLVGGHCIGVDPYYLLHRAHKLGYDPQVILSGRRINDAMPAFIARKLMQMLLAAGKNLQQAKVLVMGMTFKENVSDIRNSKVADLVREIMGYSVVTHIVDPLADADEVANAYGLALLPEPKPLYDAVIVAVAHKEYRALSLETVKSWMSETGILMDIKGVFDKPSDGITYWRL